MLGKRSRPLLRTPSKLSFPHAEDFDQKAVNAPACGKHPCVPQHVMIGFDIPQETKLSDLCESPRSVLDVNVQHPQGRSFRSYVRALPLQNRGSQGVGLAIIVDIQAEEKEDHGSLLPAGHNSASKCEQAHHHDTAVCVQSHHRHHDHKQQSQPIAIAKSCHRPDDPSTNKLSQYVRSFELEDDDTSSEGSALDMEFFDSDYWSSQQDFVLHNRISCNTDNDEDYVPRPSIFSVASFPSSCSFGVRSVSFLDACALCERAFVPGKDIFMYRGDQAFCSAECRGERMKIDEYKENLMLFYS